MTGKVQAANNTLGIFKEPGVVYSLRAAADIQLLKKSICSFSLGYII